MKARLDRYSEKQIVRDLATNNLPPGYIVADEIDIYADRSQCGDIRSMAIRPNILGTSL